jgi:hypothetical protein
MQDTKGGMWLAIGLTLLLAAFWALALVGLMEIYQKSLEKLMMHPTIGQIVLQAMITLFFFPFFMGFRLFILHIGSEYPLVDSLQVRSLVYGVSIVAYYYLNSVRTGNSLYPSLLLVFVYELAYSLFLQKRFEAYYAKPYL